MNYINEIEDKNEVDIIENLNKAINEYDNKNIYESYEYIIKAYEQAIYSKSNLTLKVLLVDATIYIEQKLYNKAYEILIYVMECSRENESYFFEAVLELSKIDFIQRQERKAISKLNRALNNIHRDNMNQYWNKLCKYLCYAYKQLGEDEKGNEYLNMIISV